MKEYKIFDALLSVKYDSSELIRLINLLDRDRIDTGRLMGYIQSEQQLHHAKALSLKEKQNSNGL